MNSDAFYYWTPRGTAIIKKSQHSASRWALLFESKEGLIALVQDGFTEPQDAATCAYQKNFTDDDTRRFWRAIHVPDSIDNWSALRPERRKARSLQNN
jgi:hypothetical protein